MRKNIFIIIVILCFLNCQKKTQNDFLGRLEVSKTEYKLGEIIEVKEYINNQTSNIIFSGVCT